MTNIEKKSLPKKLFPFIWHFLKKNKFVFFLYSLIAFAAGFWGPLNSVFIKGLIDVLPSVSYRGVGVLILPGSLILMNFILFEVFTWRSIDYIKAKFLPEIISRMIAKLRDHCLGQSNQFYQENLSGKISKQITNLADGVESLANNITANFLRGASLLLISFIAAYFANPIFCVILVTWFVLFATVSVLMSKKLVSLSDAQALSESIVTGELVDTLSNHSNIRIFSGKSYEKLRIAPFLKKQEKAYRATYLYSVVMCSIQGGLIALMMFFCIYFLIVLYEKNMVSIGDFALILGLATDTGYMTWFTLSEISEFNKSVGRCKQSLDSLLLPLEIKDKPNATKLNCKYGQIIFDQVNFHYKESKPLFEHLSIEIQTGQKVGLVGYSGGGKSTFVNLILRLYDVTKGAVLIDGEDIRKVTLDSLRENIAMIPQDSSLFNRSLMDNIRYGRIKATDEEIIMAAKKANAHEFITTLPQGYDSLVGERGVKLSGGQRQRIAIARAILKNAPILILDEATSQLDSLTEELIQKSLWELMQQKTTLVIAHRLSTLLHMDRILVFNQGKIIEDGPHRELIANNGFYKTLWEAQVGGFLPDKA